MKENLPQADNIRLNEDATKVVIIDQTLLPNELRYLELDEEEACFDAIKTLKVRGAPAIGIFAGYAMYVLAKKWEQLPLAEFQKKLEEVGAFLNSARPTAVNLSWAVRRMIEAAKGSLHSESGRTVPMVLAWLGHEAKQIQQEDINMCRSIAVFGLSLLKDRFMRDIWNR